MTVQYIAKLNGLKDLIRMRMPNTLICCVSCCLLCPRYDKVVDESFVLLSDFVRAVKVDRHVAFVWISHRTFLSVSVVN